MTSERDVGGYRYLEEHSESVLADSDYIHSHYRVSDESEGVPLYLLGGRDAGSQVRAAEEEAGEVAAALQDYTSGNPPAPIPMGTSDTASWTQIFQDVSFSTFPTIAQLKQVDVAVGDRRVALDASSCWEYMHGVLHLTPTLAPPRPGVLSGGPTRHVSLLAAMPDSTLVGAPVNGYCRAVGDSGLHRKGTQCWRWVVGSLNGYDPPFNSARGVDVRYLMRTYPHPQFNNPNYRVVVTRQSKYVSHIAQAAPSAPGSLSLPEFFNSIDDMMIYG
ncbi:hypothetical protein BDZ89DRAFT_1135288 [Hymenopellis radicata]|nr:hypothetical protein BDZ89DRAFT_1135288 [Hymenopellis radicata]